MQADAQPKDIALVDKGIASNSIASDFVGIGAVAGLETDVIAQPGVTYVLLLEGINDIGLAAETIEAQDAIYHTLISGYEQIITKLHTFGIPVFASTITPISAPSYAETPNYYVDPYGTREKTRLKVKHWIMQKWEVRLCF